MKMSRRETVRALASAGAISLFDIGCGDWGNNLTHRPLLAKCHRKGWEV